MSEHLKRILRCRHAEVKTEAQFEITDDKTLSAASVCRAEVALLFHIHSCKRISPEE